MVTRGSGDSLREPARDAPGFPHGAGLVRCALAVAIALSLAAAPSAIADDIATPDWTGVNLTGAPSVTVGLHLAHAYWHMTVPATVTIVDTAGWLAVAEVAPVAGGGYGRHIGVTRTALTTWPAGTSARRTQLPALLVHEYGHLLGYRDGELYAADPRHVMLEYSNYLLSIPDTFRTARAGALTARPQISSGSIAIAPAGHSAAQMPHPLQ